MRYQIDEIDLNREYAITIQKIDYSRSTVEQYFINQHVRLVRWRTDIRDAENVAFSILRDYLKKNRAWKLVGRELNEAILALNAHRYIAHTFLFEKGNHAVITDKDVQHAIQVGPQYDSTAKTPFRAAPGWLSEDVDDGRTIKASELMKRRMDGAKPLKF